VYASASASVSFDGSQVPVRKGSHWAADDPLVLENPGLFSNDARYGMLYTREPEGYDVPPDDAPVETTTAAPGEKRSTRRRTPDIEF
jgi:hypothetical protein